MIVWVHSGFLGGHVFWGAKKRISSIIQKLDVVIREKVASKIKSDKKQKKEKKNRGGGFNAPIQAPGFNNIVLLLIVAISSQGPGK